MTYALLAFCEFLRLWAIGVPDSLPPRVPHVAGPTNIKLISPGSVSDPGEISLIFDIGVLPQFYAFLLRFHGLSLCRNRLMRLLGPPATPPRNNLVGLLGPPVAEMNFTRSLSQSFTSLVSPLLLVQSSDTVWKLPAEAIDVI